VIFFVLWYAEFTFRGCRMPGDHHFTLDKCQLTGQVFNIRRVVIGVSSDWNATDNPPKCSSSILYCSVYQTINFHDEIMSCNGKPNCSFSQAVFSYTSYSSRCSIITRRNFIQLYYSCINGKKNLFGLRLLLYSEFLQYCYAYTAKVTISEKTRIVRIRSVKRGFCRLSVLSNYSNTIIGL